jgi:rhodanese-related sulfurtransferase
VVHGNGKAHQSPGKRIVVVGGSAAGPKVAAKARRLHLSCRDPLHPTRRKIDAGETPVILDARGPDEYEQMRLGIGEHLVPLGALRGRLNELPADKEAEIICFCKISLRGYEAARALMGSGLDERQGHGRRNRPGHTLAKSWIGARHWFRTGVEDRT